MATLHEYFVRDAQSNLTVHETWNIHDQNGTVAGDFIARAHYDFEANAMYVSFYFPEMPAVTSPEVFGLRHIDVIRQWSSKTEVHAGFSGELKDARDLVFTGQIYLYSERPVDDTERARLHAEAKLAGHHLVFRSGAYVEERNKWEKPQAFISHDSRDKIAIAQPLALELLKMQCTVWYDEFSLSVGDSLRDSIERGLKDCKKCVFLLTPNFLANGGWAKREYDSIFTRELVEQTNVILPVWAGVTKADVYKYSPALADRVAALWQDGSETVARKLAQSIQ